MIYAGHESIPNVPDAAGLPRMVIALRLKQRAVAPVTERTNWR